MAIDLTGISNVNEFYSHHYLDSLLDGDLKGLFKKWNEEEERSPYEKLSGITHRYFKAKTEALNEKRPEERAEITQSFHIHFLTALGYTVEQTTKYIEDGQSIPALVSEKRDENEYLWIIEQVFHEDDVSIFEQPLTFYKNRDDIKWFEGSIDNAIQSILRLDEPPRWVLLLAGQKVYLIDRNKWGQGKYLLFDLDELFGRKQADTLKATSALLSKDALSPQEGSILHDELDENSHKHAFSVSEDLKYGIRRAVELIGNEFIYYRSKIAKQKLYGEEELAGNLTKESLSYLYRLLFLFYAESRSEELNVVPMKSEEYRLGYSLETLRDLEQVPLTTDKSREGYFIHESLTTLFKIVNEGFGSEDQLEVDYESGEYVDYGFEIDGLQSPLFDSNETPLLSSVKFRNFVLQEVIQLLSLSKEGSKQRGRISYAQLGINQLGAVYEGLLSYSGFFAQETLYEVKPTNVSSTDETGQSYFVPESEIEQYKENEFVYILDEDGTKLRKKYERGSFIFRLAGRDREKSASYYTPEVLTKSLVKYSLKELLKDKNADEILELTICEPAMGSGAFLNEAINQLADAYLERKQKELRESIHPDNYSDEKQRVKAYLATNNIYGVDLNPTAVELAKISLWLNTIYEGSKTPWFSSRLAVGNSLIGARKEVYRKEDLINGKWQDRDLQSVNLNQSRDHETIYHFLIPDKAMAAFENDKVVKSIAKDNIETIKSWRNEFTQKFDSKEVDSLKEISKRIDELWQRHYTNRINLLSNTRETVNVWGKKEGTSEKRYSIIEHKEKELNKVIKSPTSPYSALKMVMDYWCSLWFWPIHNSNLLPTRDEYILDLNVILDSAEGFGPDLQTLEKNVDRLRIVKAVSERMKFVHWELEFTEVFFKQGGFDLIVGNPPWIKFTWEEKGVLSEKNPLINLRKLTAKNISNLRENIILNEKDKQDYLNEFSNITGQKSFLSSKIYKELNGVQLNLYKSFIILGLWLGNTKATISYIHQEGVYDDPKGGNLRHLLYNRLKYHFQFINELKLFAEIDHHNKFGLSIFSNRVNDQISFKNISNLFHPKTIDESYVSNGKGIVPGIKDENFSWELKGHKNRIITVDKELLSIINLLYEDEKVSVSQTKLLNIHSEEINEVLKKLSKYSYTLKDLKEEIFDTEMFHETNDQEAGNIIRETFIPKDINELVISGPHFFVATPYKKNPNEGCKHNLDYSPIKLQVFDHDFLPRTNYRISGNGYTSIPIFNGKKVTSSYRQIIRKMLSPTGERTLIGALIPKGPSHTNGCISLNFNNDHENLVLFSGISSSIVIDFYIKSTGRNNLYKEIYSLPRVLPEHCLAQFIIHRTLRLNSLTSHYSELWQDLYNESFNNDSYSIKDTRLSEWKYLSEKWDSNTPIKNDFERRIALIELDVLTALVLGLSFKELLTIYRVQFSVLQKYESQNYYDQSGMLVPKPILTYYEKNGNNIVKNDPNLEGFIPPFDKCNREADMKQAYEYFSKILNEKI
ncbi:Eco57I restriction-modification methylase domain-containing protein [Peribacillus frigoritolerans]